MWNHLKSWQNQKIYFRVSETSDQCWYSIGFSPPSGSKKAVFRFQSVNSIVKIPAANIGSDSNMAVIRTNHMNNSVDVGIWKGFILIVVVIKLITAKIEETPARYRENTVNST